MMKLRSQLLQRMLVHHSRHSMYIHLKDHNKKINPEDTKLNLSYMNPTVQTDISPQQPEFRSRLSRKIQKDLDKQVFEDYKNKLLQGEIDTEEVVEPDPLWGDDDKPLHYYKNLSRTQATWLTHSQFIDLQEAREQLIKEYLKDIKPVTSFQECTELSDLGDLAAGMRLRGELNREIFYAIQQKIGNLFHKLSDKALLLLKFGFNQSPKMGTPTFNTILNDLIIEALPQFSHQDLVQLFYANRHDGYKVYKPNLQKKILRQLDSHYKNMTLQEKVNWVFLFVDARGPIIPRQAHNRHWNQVREMAHSMLYKMDFPEDLSELSEENALKLAYVLYRSKALMAEHIADSLAVYVDQALEAGKLSARGGALFFIYFAEINGGKSIQNQQLMSRLKDFVVGSWSEHKKIDQLRSLYAMFVLNLYDEATHQLYTGIEMEADNTQLAYFCRLEFMNSSGREWQVMHLMAELEELPLRYFQDYKRFVSYVKITAPDWDLQPLQEKLVNLEIFYNADRLQSFSIDKPEYSKWKSFANFSERRILPYSQFRLGKPIKNLEFADFMLWDHQISVDIVTDVHVVPGSRDLKGSFLAKVKSLENLGWRHLYVFQEDIAFLDSNQLFGYLNSLCQPYFQEQAEVIAQSHAYKGEQIDYIINENYWRTLKGSDKESWINDPEGKAKRDAQADEQDENLAKNLSREGDVQDDEFKDIGAENQEIMLAEYKRYMKAISGKK